MRDLIHIAGLLSLFAFLGIQFPGGAVNPALVADGRGRPFASFVMLSPEAYASCLDAARTSWQVRSEARSRLAIGRLDSGIPLLDDSIAAPEFPIMNDAAPAPSRLPPPDVETYSLLPSTMGMDVPALSTRATASAGSGEKEGKQAAFSREEMLSVDGMKTLKEIMQ